MRAPILRLSHDETRSTRADVRNPVMALPSAREIAALPPEARAALRRVLLDIRHDARERAEKAWRSNKGPMAAYWKAVSVYAGHISRVCRDSTNPAPVAALARAQFEDQVIEVAA